jgi:hypothetical protein
MAAAAHGGDCHSLHLGRARGAVDGAVPMSLASRLYTAVAAAALAAAAAGCSFAATPVHVDQLSVTYASAPQPVRVRVPLHLFVNPATVPDDVVTDDPRIKPIPVHSLRTFVRRDVRRLLDDHFMQISVADQAPVSATPYLVAEVTIAKLSVVDKGGTLVASDGTVVSASSAVATLDWSFVIRDGLTDEVVYSFAEQAAGTSISSVDDTPILVASVLEAALRGLAADLRTQDLGARFAPEPSTATARRPAPASGDGARDASGDDDAERAPPP